MITVYGNHTCYNQPATNRIYKRRLFQLWAPLVLVSKSHKIIDTLAPVHQHPNLVVQILENKGPKKRNICISSLFFLEPFLNMA